MGRRVLGEDDDEKLELDGFTPAGVGYGNITEEYLERVKKKKVTKAEKKKMAKEADKEKEGGHRVCSLPLLEKLWPGQEPDIGESDTRF